MIRRAISGIRALAAEALGSLLLVVVLFSLFMLFLYAIFPAGTQLKELVQDGMEQAPGGSNAARQQEATLSSLYRDVRFRRGNSVEWGGAKRGMPLYDQDAVQTLDEANAGISFGPRDRLTVGSNSLVVVTRLDAGDDAGPRSYRVQVAGDITGTLSAARKLSLELAAAGHVARIMPGEARFKVTRDGDSAASLAVYAGEAQIRSGERVVRVPAQYGVRLLSGVAVGDAVQLPPAPRLEQEQARYRYRLLPPRITFAWSGASKSYRFQLARDARFSRCLLDEKVEGPRFVTGKLDSGSYFWRVSGVRDGVEGGYSRVGRCRLEQLLKEPVLRVNFPGHESAAGPYTLTGSLEPGSRVYLNGVEAATDSSGVFRRDLTLKEGVNLIRVEAVDAAGNASYASRVVYGRRGYGGSGAQTASAGETGRSAGGSDAAPGGPGSVGRGNDAGGGHGE